MLRAAFLFLRFHWIRANREKRGSIRWRGIGSINIARWNSQFDIYLQPAMTECTPDQWTPNVRVWGYRDARK